MELYVEDLGEGFKRRTAGRRLTGQVQRIIDEARRDTGHVEWFRRRENVRSTVACDHFLSRVENVEWSSCYFEGASIKVHYLYSSLDVIRSLEGSVRIYVVNLSRGTFRNHGSMWYGLQTYS